MIDESSTGGWEELQAILSPQRVKTAPEDLASWGCDWTRSYRVAPAAVVFPETVDEVAALTRLANTEGWKLVPSGLGGSGPTVIPHAAKLVKITVLIRSCHCR